MPFITKQEYPLRCNHNQELFFDGLSLDCVDKVCLEGIEIQT